MTALGHPPFEFDRDTSIEPADGGATAVVRPGWRIGSNPNGGYLLSLVVRALQSVGQRPDPLSVTAYFLSPPTLGPVFIETEAIRSGRTVATVAGRLFQDGRERVRVIAAFGDLGSFDGPTRLDLARPAIAPPEQCIALADAIGNDQRTVEFSERVELVCPKDNPWVRSERPTVDGWVRFRDRRPPDVLSLLLFADAYPPAVLGIVPAGWVPTIELTVHVRGRPDPGWLLGSFRTRALIDGLMETDGELWDASGRLVAMARQLALVLPPATAG